MCKLTRRMVADRGHRVHIRVGDVFDRHRYVVVPTSDRLVVGCCKEPPVLVYESNCVDRSQMLIVCLDDLVGPGVVLDDLLVGHTGQPDVLLVRIRVVFDDIRHLSIRERLNTFAGLGVPRLDIPVIRCGEEFGALVVEGHILDGLRVPQECPEAIAFVVDIP